MDLLEASQHDLGHLEVKATELAADQVLPQTSDSKVGKRNQIRLLKFKQFEPFLFEF